MPILLNIDEKENELLRKAELLMELRGYQRESLYRSEEAINICTSDPDSKKTVRLHIVTKSNLKSNGVGVERARDAVQSLEEKDVDKVIIFGKKFTDAAREELKEEGIEFFSKKHRILSTLNAQEQYSKLLDCVNNICENKCNKIPKSESDCGGYSKEQGLCSSCLGTGKLPRSTTSYYEQRCPVCSGTGLKEKHYSCKIRLISDNADFHFEHNWLNLLQNDLLSLLNISTQTKKNSQSEETN